MLLLIQLGAGDESEEVFKTLRPLLKTTLLDKSACVKARTSVRIYRPDIFSVSLIDVFRAFVYSQGAGFTRVYL